MRTIIESLKIALQALWSHKLRSILTTLGIVIGVVTVVGIISIIQGLNTGFASQISSLGTDVLYIDRYPWVISSNEEWWAVHDRPRIGIDEYEYIANHSLYAKQVVPQVMTNSDVREGKNSLERVTIVGTSEAGLQVGFGPQDVAEGRFLSFVDVNRNRMVAVIGNSIAENLFPDKDPLGEYITVGNHRFMVSGVLAKQGNFLGNDMDSNVYMPYGAFAKTFGAWRSYTIAVKLQNPGQMEDARLELTGLMRTVRQLKPREEANFTINNQDVLLDFYKKITGGLWATAIGIGGISLLVGGIGIMNIMLVSVTERTKEIGVRKALGARRIDIMIQFLIESMMVSLVGVSIGLLFALGVALAVDKLSPLPASINASWALMGTVFVVVIGVIFGLWPASRAAKLNPIEALRYE